MKALLWKEFHQNRGLLLTGLVLWLMPYCLVALALSLEYSRTGELAPRDWVEASRAAGYGGLTVFALLCPFFGGNAFAGERADRSAEFVTYLPIPRGAVIASKLLFAARACALFWLASIAVVCSLSGSDIWEWNLVSAALGFASVGVTLFGVAWFCSSFLPRPGQAAAVGLAVPIVILITLEIFSNGNLPPPKPETVAAGCAVIGLTGVAAGAVLYYRRVEA